MPPLWGREHNNGYDEFNSLNNYAVNVVNIAELEIHTDKLELSSSYIEDVIYSLFYTYVRALVRLLLFLHHFLLSIEALLRVSLQNITLNFNAFCCIWTIMWYKM